MYAMNKNKLEFILPNSGTLKISSDAKKILMESSQDKIHKNEAGGVLIGRYILFSNDVIIDSVTTSSGKDKRGKYFFNKVDRLHQRILDKKWKQSEGTSNYLGEWHTHPEPVPSPSELDFNEWKRKSIEDVYDHQFLIFIIVGTEAIKCWWINRKGIVHSLKEKPYDV